MCDKFIYSKQADKALYSSQYDLMMLDSVVVLNIDFNAIILYKIRVFLPAKISRHWHDFARLANQLGPPIISHTESFKLTNHSRIWSIYFAQSYHPKALLQPIRLHRVTIYLTPNFWASVISEIGRASHTRHKIWTAWQIVELPFPSPVSIHIPSISESSSNDHQYHSINGWIAPQSMRETLNAFGLRIPSIYTFAMYRKCQH